MKTTKILISGAGSIGSRHLKNLIALGYKNLVVCDPDGKRLNRIPKIGRFPTYTNFLLALKKERPSVVFICSPTTLHLRQANQSLDYGADIFIEKPLSHSLAGIDKLIIKSAKLKKVVMVGCNYRFNKGWQTLKKSLKSGSFGQPLLARITLGYYLPTARKNVNYKKVYAASTKGGGVILDSGSHVVDYLHDLFGKMKKVLLHIPPSNILGIASEEMAVLAFQHHGGVESIVLTDYISQKTTHRLEAVTTKGILTWNFIDDLVTFENNTHRRVIYRGKKDTNQMFLDEIKHFFECIKKRKKPLQSLADAKAVIKVLQSN